ncbi:DUF559 domain-containing protein [Rhodococcus sp. NPDC078407]|uniref:DUF559 domain-containing protein n=1 Tax=Rhodococcus sp. NPDC078407 TaxID=3364509 RepID=UPI0037C7AC5A
MGVYTAQQLVAQGISTSTISRRSQSGELVRLLPKVYATEKPDYFGLCTGVTLWKSQAVLSHESAAWLWGLIEYEPRLVDVTVAPNVQSRSVPWVRVHRRRLVEVQLHRGLRVVSLEQTFVDVATSLSTPNLEKFFDNAIDHHLPWRRVTELCSTSKGMHGKAAVRTQLRTCCPRTLSEPERVVARALAARHFAMEINARVGKFYGDLVDYRAQVIVEIDGREFHSDPATFNNDRRRQNELVLDGWLVLRYSAATALADLDRVVDEIITVVRRRRKSIAATGSRLP